MSHDLEEQIKEDSNSIKELEKIVDNNIRIINNCIDLTYEDIIIKMYENYRQVFALNGNIAEAKNIIDEALSEKTRLSNIKAITLNDVMEEISSKVMIIYMVASYATYLTSTDVLDFIKKYIIISLIGIGSFKINSDFFKSDFRKKKISSKISQIDEILLKNRYSIETMEKYRELFQKELEIEQEKLEELLPRIGDDEDYEDYIKRVFPYVENVEFIPVEDKEKSKVKVKKKKNKR